MRVSYVLVAAVCLAVIGVAAADRKYAVGAEDIVCESPATTYALRKELGGASVLSVVTKKKIFRSAVTTATLTLAKGMSVSREVTCADETETACAEKDGEKKPLFIKVDENTVKMETWLVNTDKLNFDKCTITATVAPTVDRSAAGLVEALVGHGDYSIMDGDKVNAISTTEQGPCSTPEGLADYIAKVTELVGSSIPASASIVRDSTPGAVAVMEGDKTMYQCVMSTSDGTCTTPDNVVVFKFKGNKHTYPARTLFLQPPIEGYTEGCAVVATLQQTTPNMDKIEGDYNLAEDLSNCRVEENGKGMVRPILEDTIDDKSLPEKLGFHVDKNEDGSYSVKYLTGDGQYGTKTDCKFDDSNPNICMASEKPVLYLSKENIVELAAVSLKSHATQEFEGCTAVATRDHDDGDDSDKPGPGGKSGFPKWAWIVIGLGTGMVVIGVAVGLFMYTKQQKAKKESMDYSKLQVDSQA